VGGGSHMRARSENGGWESYRRKMIFEKFSAAG